MLVDDYARQFAGLSEELDLDYNASASSLRGADINRLEEEIVELLNERMDRTRENYPGDEFKKLGVLLYLQTADEIWKDHIAYIQNLILSTQLCGYHGRGDMAAFTLTSFESYELFQTRIADSYLPKLSGFPGGPSGGPRPPRVELSQDVLRILV